MRFSLLTYKKNPLADEPGKVIGVLVQSGKEILFDYAKNLDKLKSYDPEVDKFLVMSLGKTIESVIEKKTVYISSPDKPGMQTTPGDIEFLEDLKRSYQGKVQFTNIREANYPEPKIALQELYQQYVIN